MKEGEIVEKLYKDGDITEQGYQKLNSAYSNRLFSVGIELRTILYAGILLLTSGLGILVYKNIDTIGHLAVISFIALVSAACFVYCYMKSFPYSNLKVKSPHTFSNYILLLGCLTFAIFMGYLQYQYSTFGLHNEIAFLIPAIIFFAAAYYFDNLGVLSMAITALAGFIGIAITPTELLSNNDFSSHSLILSGLGLGAFLVGAALLLNHKKIKAHFTFTYLNFAVHLLFVSCLAGMFAFDDWFLFTLLLVLFVFLVGRHAYKEKSFYYLLFTVIYGYIGVSYVFFRVFVKAVESIRDFDVILIYLVPMYFIGSSVYIVMFLRKTNKKFKPDADI